MENEYKPCCPKFNPEGWDNKTMVWQDKLFIKDTVCAIFHIPMGLSKALTRMYKKTQEAQAAPELKDWLLLSYEGSPWQSQQYMTVTKEVPGAENVKISGTFLAKVFEGPYRNAPKWYKQMGEFTAAQGKPMKKMYFYYTTCPKCAKFYGKNYVVAIAEI